MSPYSKLKEQGIDMSGLISVNNLHRAINTAGFDHTDIDDADVADILANAGFTRQEYNENEDIQGKVFKIHVNNLLDKAILSTENKKWNTIPKAYQELDNLREEYERQGNDEKLLFLEDWDHFLQDLEKQYQ